MITKFILLRFRLYNNMYTYAYAYAYAYILTNLFITSQ